MESESIESILATIEERPRDAMLFQRLGQLYMRGGRLEEARQAYEQSLELEPTDAFTHLYLGNVFYGCKMYPEALARFQHAAKLLPNEAVAYWCQGDVYRAQGRYHLAQDVYEAAVRVDPDNLTAQQKYAEWYATRDGTANGTRNVILVASRKYHAATTVLLAERWLRTHPDDYLVLLDYAEMLHKMTRYEDALRVYQDALAKVEGDRDQWASLKGGAESAEIAKLDNETVRWGIFNQIGRMYEYWGRLDEAEPWFRKAIATRPDAIASYVFLGGCQARQGKLREAEATHRAATQCSDSSLKDEAYHNLGLVLRAQGRFAEAAECFRKAIELDPQYTDAIEALDDVESALALLGEESHGD